jgi:hypothetical protein
MRRLDRLFGIGIAAERVGDFKLAVEAATAILKALEFAPYGRRRHQEGLSEADKEAAAWADKILSTAIGKQ